MFDEDLSSVTSSSSTPDVIDRLDNQNGSSSTGSSDTGSSKDAANDTSQVSVPITTCLMIIIG